MGEAMKIFKRKLRKQVKNSKTSSRRSNKVLLEPLEPRLLLSADLAFQATGAVNNLTLQMQNVQGVDTLQVVDTAYPTNVLASQALADTSAVVITGGTEGDKLTIDFTNPFSTPVSFTDTSASGQDTLGITGGDRTWNITGSNGGTSSGTATGTVTFTGIENLSGGPNNNDTFVFSSGASESGVIDGGSGGTDTLDYSALTSPVSVNLGAGTATATAGVINIENIFGGSANDLITGDANANILTGGGGNDTLAGGAGNDIYLFDANVALGTDIITESSGGGTDTLDFSPTTTTGAWPAQTIDLSKTTPQAVNANLTITLSAANVLENVVGASLNIGSDVSVTGNQSYGLITVNGTWTLTVDGDLTIAGGIIGNMDGSPDSLNISATGTVTLNDLTKTNTELLNLTISAPTVKIEDSTIYVEGNFSLIALANNETTWEDLVPFYDNNVAKTDIDIISSQITAGQDIIIKADSSNVRDSDLDVDFAALSGLKAMSTDFNPAITFVNSGSADRIQRDVGSWIEDGFKVGQTIAVSGPTVNAGVYTVTAVTSTALTLGASDSLIAEAKKYGLTIVERKAAFIEQATTALNFSGKSITRSVGNWANEGFVAGMTIYISGTPGNDGSYTIASINGSLLTAAKGFAAESNIRGAVIEGDRIVMNDEGGRVTITFVHNGAGTDTLTRSSGSWITDGFQVGQRILISGYKDGGNDIQATIAGMTAGTLTLTAGDSVGQSREDVSGISVAGVTAKFTEPATTQITFTSNEDAADTIARNAGSWVADGFVGGMMVTVFGTPDGDGDGVSDNDGMYEIATVTPSTLTLTEDEQLKNQTASGIKMEQSFKLSSAELSQVTTLTLDGSTITRDTGSWLEDGFLAGQTVTISGSAKDNDGDYSVTVVTEKVLTLSSSFGAKEVTTDVNVMETADSADAMTPYNPELTLDAAGTLYRDAGKWADDGFVAGMTILIDGSAEGKNNGKYVIDSISADGKTLTLSGGPEAITAETSTDLTVAEDTEDGVQGVATTSDPRAKAELTAVIPLLTFVNNGFADQIIRSLGSWVDDGFEVGRKIIIENSGDNDGTYTVAAVTATALTLSANDRLTDETLSEGVSVSEVQAYLWSTSPGLVFAENGAAPDTITRNSGSWIADGFVAGMTIDVSGTAANDNFYTIASISADGLTLTLSSDSRLVNESRAKLSEAPPDLNFTDNGSNPDTIKRSAGNWSTDGFQVGDAILVSGTQSNDNDPANLDDYYTIAGISADGLTLTLSAGNSLATETGVKYAEVVGAFGAKMTGMLPTLTFNAAGTISRSKGSWWEDSFQAGQQIRVFGSQNNNNTFTIASISDDGLTMTVSGTVTAESGTAGIQVLATAGVQGVRIVEATSYGELQIAHETLVFNAAARTITRTVGNWKTDGFVDSDRITVSGTVNNDGTYAVASASAKTLTLKAGTVLTNETAAETVSVVTTLANLTGSPTITFHAETGGARNWISRSDVKKGGSFVTDGFQAGMTITVSGTASNNDTYLVDEVLFDRIMLKSGEKLVNETDSDLSIYADLTAANVPLVARDSSGDVEGNIFAGAAQFFLETSSDVIEGAESLMGFFKVMPVQVVRGAANSSIDIYGTDTAGTTLNADGIIDIEALSASEVDAEAVSIILGVAVGVSHANASAVIGDYTTATAGVTFDLKADVSNILNATATATSGTTDFGNFIFNIAKKVTVPGPSLAVSVGIADSTSTATIANTAAVTADSVSVTAGNTNDFKTSTLADAKRPSRNFGEAIGVTVADYDSTATATLGGTITTTAGDTTDDGKVIPSLDVSADSVFLHNIVKTWTKVRQDDTIGEKIKNTIRDKLNLTLFKKFSNDPGAEGYGGGGGVSIAGAVTVAFFDSSAEASIRPDATVTSAGGVSVDAYAEDNSRRQAISYADIQTKTSFSGAVLYSDSTSNARAFVGKGATITLSGDLDVTATSTNPDPFRFDNLLMDVWNGLKNFTWPDFPEVTGPIDFFEDCYDWGTNLMANDLITAGMDLILPLLGVGDPFDPDSMATTNVVAIARARSGEGSSGGSKLAISGSANIFEYDNDANAYLDEGVQVTFTGADHNLNVTANAEIETINIGGFWQFTDFPVTMIKNLVTGKSQITVGTNVESAGGAVGGTFDGIWQDNDSKAYIADGVVIKGVDEVNVSSDAENWVVTITQSGSKGKVGLNGAVGYSNVDNTSKAWIEDKAKINAAGDVTVDAESSYFGVNIAGAISQGGNFAFGASVGINDIDNVTYAFIGNQLTSVDYTEDGHITSGGDISVSADSSETLWNFTVAGSSAAGTEKNKGGGGNENPPDGKLAKLVNRLKTIKENLKGPEREGTGVGVSGAVAINLVSDDTRAYISDIALVDATGDVLISAENGALAVVGTGAIMVNLAPKGGGLAGAFSWNDLTRITQAYTQDTTIDATNLDVNALSDDLLIGVSAGGSGAKPTSKNINLAGSVNINFVDNDTLARIGEDTIATVAGNVLVDGQTHTRIIGVAGGVAISGKAGVGAAADFDEIDNTTEASIISTSTIDAGGNVLVTADSSEWVISIAASIGIGGKGLGLSGAAGIQAINTDVDAYIGEGANISAEGSVLVDADDANFIVGVGGTAAGGKKAGVGLSAVVSLVTRDVKAYIGDGAQITAYGSGIVVDDPHTEWSGRRGVIVDATAEDDLYLIAAGGSYGGNFALAASAATGVVDSDLQAYIGSDAIITADDGNSANLSSVYVAADQDSNFVIVGGSASGSKKVGIGAAAGVLVFDRNVDAYIGAGAEVTADGDVLVDADLNETVWAVAAGVGGSGKVQVNGSATVLVLTGSTLAAIENNAQVTADGNVKVTADSHADLSTIAGTAGFGLKAGFGISASVLVHVDSVTALVGDNAQVTALGAEGLLVAADSSEELLTIAAGLAGGGKVGITGSAVVNVLDEDTKASIGNSAKINKVNTSAATTQGVIVSAEDTTVITAAAGSVGIGAGGVGIGAGADIEVITKDTQASIGGGTVVNAADDVLVTADSSEDVISVAANAGVGGKAGLAGSAGVYVVTTDTEATITGGATIFAGGDVMVAARGDFDLLDIAGQLSAGGTAGVGIAALVLVHTDTVTASIGEGASVTARGAGTAVQAVTGERDANGDWIKTAASGVVVTAVSYENITGAAVGGSFGGTAGVAGSAIVNVMTETTRASIGQNAIVSATGASGDPGVTLVASDDTGILSIAGAVALGGTAGIGAGVDVEVLTKITEACIGTKADMDADGNVSIMANSSEDLLSIPVSGAIGGTAAIAGSFGVSVLTLTTQAYIEDGTSAEDRASIEAGGSMAVSAGDETEIDIFAGNIAGGGTVGVGIAAAVPIVTKTVDAYIGAFSYVDADALFGIVVKDGGFGAPLYAPYPVFSAGCDVTFALNGMAADTITRSSGSWTTDGYKAGQAIQISGTTDGENDGTFVIDSISEDGSTLYLRGGENVQGLSQDETITGSELTIQMITDETGAITAPPATKTDINGDGVSDFSNDTSQNGRRSVAPSTQTVSGVAVAAVNQDTIRTYGLSGGAAGTVAVNVGGDVQVSMITTRAYVASGADIDTEGSVLVGAGSDYETIGVAAGISISGTVSVTPSVVVAVLTLTTEAYIDDGAGVDAGGDIVVKAKASEDILSIAAGVAGSGMVSVGGSIPVTVLTTTTRAFIGEDGNYKTAGNDGIYGTNDDGTAPAAASATAGGNILVSAQDDTDADVIAGSLGIGIGAVGIGASVGVTVITKDTEAFIGDYAVVDALASTSSTLGDIYTGEFDENGDFETESGFKGLAVQAGSSEDLLSIAAAGGVGFYAGIGGGVAVEIISSDTRAYVGEYAKINTTAGSEGSAQSVNLTAVNDAKVLSIGGGLGIGIAGIGGGVDVGILRSDTAAYIGNNAVVEAKKDVDVNALAVKDVDTFALTVGVGAVGIAGSVSVWTIGGGLQSNYTVDEGEESETTQDSLGTGNDSVIGFADKQASGVDSGDPENPDEQTDNGYTSILSGFTGGGDTSSNEVASRTSGASTTLGSAAPTSPVADSVVAPVPTFVPDGTVAFIGADATVAAGGDVGVRAEDRLTFDGIAGGIAGGAAAVGVSVVIGTVNGNVEAYIDNDATVTAGSGTDDNILISARYTEALNGSVYAGQVGGAAVGAQVIVLTENTSVRAYADEGASIDQAGGMLQIEAFSDRDVKALAASAAYGGVTAGATVAVVDVGGSVAAFIGGSDVGQADDMTVGSVAITATSVSSATTEAEGGAGGGITATVFVPIATIDGSTRAYVGQGSAVTAGSLDLEASSTEDAKANAIVVGVGGVSINISKGVAKVNTVTESFVQGEVGSVATLDLNDAATIDATSDSSATSEISGGGGGGISVNAFIADSTDSAKTRAYIGKNTDLDAGSLSINADGTLDTSSTAFVVGVSAIGGAGAGTVSKIDGVVEAWIGGGFDGTTAEPLEAILTQVDVAGAVVVQATSDANAYAEGKGGSGSAIGVQVLLPKATTATQTRAWLGSGVDLDALSLGITATADRRRAEAKDNLTAVSILAGGNGTSADADVTGAVQALVAGLGTTIDVTGALMITAESKAGSAIATSKMGGGAALSVNVALAEAWNDASTKAWVADSTTISDAGSVAIKADSKDSATATSSAAGGGLISGSGVKAEATAKPLTQAWIGSEVSIAAEGTVSVEAIAEIAEADATANSASGGGINVGVAYGKIDVEPTVQAWIASGTRVETESGDIIVKSELQQQQQQVNDDLLHDKVDIDTDEITFANHGLNTGDAVTYDLNGQAAIETDTSTSNNTLIAGRDYSVIRVDDNTLALGDAFNTSDVDTDRNVIVFDGAHNFRTGDAVIYSCSGGVGDDVVTPGLYYVRVIDANTIKLYTADTKRTQVTFSPTPGLITDGNRLNLSGFADGDLVTYRAPDSAPFNSLSADMKIDDEKPVYDNNNRIYVKYKIDSDNDGDLDDNDTDTGHGFSDGEFVTYTTNGTPVGGLTNGATYRVDVIDDNYIELQGYAQLSGLQFTRVDGGDDTITRSGGSWLLDGFAPGEKIGISGTLNNNNQLTIAAVTATQLSFAGDVLTTETVSGATTISGQTIPLKRQGCAQLKDLQFAQVANDDDTITRSSGSWLDDGFAAGQVVDISGTEDNNNTLTIAAVTADKLFFAGDVLTDETVDETTSITEKVNHLLIPKPLGGLENGMNYTVVNSAGGSFQLKGPDDVIVPSITVGQTGGTHSLGIEGIELGAGGEDDVNHELRIDLTGVTAGAVNKLLGPEGVSLREIYPSVGNGESLASAKGGSGGGLDVSVPTAKAEFVADVQAYVDAERVQSGGDVSITTLSAASVSTYANSRAGGVIQIGVVDSLIDYENHNNAYVGHAASGVAVKDITKDEASPQINASGVLIEAVDDFLITSDSNIKTNTKASGKGGGVISVADVDAKTDITSRTNTIIGSGATIEAKTVDVEALLSGLEGMARSEATAGGLIGGATARADHDVDSSTLLLLEGASSGLTTITGRQGMDAVATQENFDTNRETDHHWYGLFGGSSEKGDNSGTVTNMVDADPWVVVNVGVRPTATTSNEVPPSPLDTFDPFDHLALLVKANNSNFDGGGIDEGDRKIMWDADVNVDSGPSPELVIDSSGKVARATDITVNGITNPAPGTSFAGAEQIEVADIFNDGLGDVVFQAANDIDGGTVIDAPHYWGTFTFDMAFDSVRITNASDIPLWLNSIDPINTTESPRVHMDLDSGVEEELNFAINQTVGSTLIDVRNLGESDIMLRNGKLINNPVGETRMLNAGANIVGEAGLTTYLIRTRALGDANSATVPADFELEQDRYWAGTLQFVDAGVEDAPDSLTRSDGASWEDSGFVIGDLIKVEVAGQTPQVFQIAAFAGDNSETAVLNTLAQLSNQTVSAQVSRFHGIEAQGSVGSVEKPIRIESIYSPDQTAQIFGEAGTDLYLNLSARFRGMGYGDQTANVDLLTAGNDTVVTLNAAVVENGRLSTPGVDVSVQDYPAWPHTGNYKIFYRPDVRPNGIEPGDPFFEEAVGVPISSLHLNVDTTWTFGLAEAGQHVSISAADSSEPGTLNLNFLPPITPTINVLGTTNIKAGGAFVDVLTNGYIGTEASPFSEIVAVDPADGNDLRVGTIHSTYDDVFLYGPRGIIDAKNNAPAPAGDDSADVIGNTIYLYAKGGSIGDPSGGNDLEIDSQAHAYGTISAQAAGSINLTETLPTTLAFFAKDAQVTLIQALTGNVRFTVRESGAGGEDLNLLADGLINTPQGSILLRVGDNVTTDETAQILAGNNIDIYGDFARVNEMSSEEAVNDAVDPNIGTVMQLSGDIIHGPIASGYMTQIWGHTDADNIWFGNASGTANDPNWENPGYIFLGPKTIVYGSGAVDDIDAWPVTNTGIIIFGGAEGDNIRGSQGDDLIVGDNGWVNFGTTDLTDLDEVWSDAYSLDSGVTSNAYSSAGSGTIFGGNDTISGEGGSDTIIGGAGSDTIYGDNATGSHGDSEGQSVLIGDNARIFYAGDAYPGATGQFYTLGNTPILGILTTDTDETTGATDTITGGPNVDVLIGGVGAEADKLYGDSRIDVIENDNCFVIFVVDQMTAKHSAAANVSADQLTEAELSPMVAEAKALWDNALGNDSRADSLEGLQVEIADLPGDILGVTIGNTILIDNDAAGYGWFIDPTPADDSEFAKGPKPKGMDLLTVVMHEMGHVIGLTDVSAARNSMSGSLDEGVRLVPTSSTSDQFLESLRKEHLQHRLVALTLDGGKEKTIEEAIDLARERNPSSWQLDFLLNVGEIHVNPNKDIAVII